MFPLYALRSWMINSVRVCSYIMADYANEKIVLIPGVPTVWRSVVPPIEVDLPQIAYMRKGVIAFRAAFLLLLAFLGGLAACAAIFAPSPNSASAFVSIVYAIGLALTATFAAIVAAATSLRDFLDLRCKGPALVITESGLTDFRSGLELDWGDIACARPIWGNGGIFGVNLKVKDPTKLPSSRFLLTLEAMARYPDEVQVSTSFLTQRTHELSYAILTLISRAGGEILPNRGVFSGTHPLRILSQSEKS